MAGSRDSGGSGEPWPGTGDAGQWARDSRAEEWWFQGHRGAVRRGIGDQGLDRETKGLRETVVEG